MNDYDRLPAGIKIVHLLLLVAPPIAAGWLDRSWLSAAIVFFGGTLFLSSIALQIYGGMLRNKHMLPNGEIDAAPVRRAILVPFLVAGPLSGAIVAVILLR